MTRQYIRQHITLMVVAMFVIVGCQTMPRIDSEGKQANEVTAQKWIRISAGDRGLLKPP